jgi:hypothetical protein
MTLAVRRQEIKMKRCLSIVFCFAFLSLGIAGNAIADNLVVNGSFENGLDLNGNPNGWSVTTTSPESSYGVQVDLYGTSYPENLNSIAYDGSHSFYFAAGDNTNDTTAANSTGYDTLSQTLSSITKNPTTAGSYYTVTFYLDLNPKDSGWYGAKTLGNSFMFSWNGGPPVTLNPATQNEWYTYTYTEEATSSSTTISFSGRNPYGSYYLDDVSVTAAVVPEPSSVLIYATGLLVLAGARRWVRRS